MEGRLRRVFEKIIHASQGNFDSLHASLRLIAVKFNMLVEDVEALYVAFGLRPPSAAGEVTDFTDPGALPAGPEGPAGFTWNLRGVSLVSQREIEKPYGGNAWNADAYSTEGFVFGSFVTFQPGGLYDVAVGLNEDPDLDTDLSSIDYAFRLTSGGDIRIFESNVDLGSFGTYTDATKLTITYDGVYVKYIVNTTVQRIVERAPGNPLFLDTALYTDGAVVKNIHYGPMGQSVDLIAPPIGTILAWTSDLTVPSEWLKCEGQEVSRTEYAELNQLFEDQGYPFGNGNGTTTFNVPDLRGRTIIGISAGDAAIDSLAEVAGSLRHTHVTAHGHTVSGSSGSTTHDHAQTTTGSAGGHSHGISSDGGHSHSSGNISGSTSTSGGSHSHDEGSLSTFGPSTTTSKASGTGTAASPTHLHVISGSTGSTGIGHSHSSGTLSSASTGSAGSHNHGGTGSAGGHDHNIPNITGSGGHTHGVGTYAGVSASPTSDEKIGTPVMAMYWIIKAKDQLAYLLAGQTGLPHDTLLGIGPNDHHQEDHAGRHASAGDDPVTPAAIGAATSGHDHSGVYDPAGTAAGAVATHEGLSDPHSVYATDTDLSTHAGTEGAHHAKAHQHTAAGDGGALTADEHSSYSEYAEIEAPATPAADKIRVYAKDVSGNSKLFYKGDDGVEVGPLISSAQITGGYAEIRDEGSALTARTVIDFRGDLVTAADDGGAAVTAVTLPGWFNGTPADVVTGAGQGSPGAGFGVARGDHSHGYDAPVSNPLDFIEGMTGYMWAEDDFTNKADSSWNGVDNGSGGTGSGTTSGASFADHPGVIDLNTGTDSTGWAGVLSQTDAFRFTNGIARIGMYIRTAANLSDGTNRYNIVAGWFDDPNVADGGNNVLAFRYTDNAHSGQWHAVAKNNATGGTVALDTSPGPITVAANTWYRLEIVLNAAGSSAEFYIDGEKVGTITSNIPDSSRALRFGVRIRKALGTTSRPVRVDAYYVYKELSR